MTLTAINNRLTKIEKVLSYQNREAWAPAYMIMRLTGLKPHQMKRIRDCRTIEWRKVEGGYEYDLNTIPKALLKNQQ